VKTKLSNLVLCILAASVLSSCKPAPPGDNEVVSNGKKVKLAVNYQGTATSFTSRNDAYSIGYFIKDGAVVKQNSLLADQDGPVSKLKLDIKANGEAFNAVVAKGKGTDLTLTGSVSVTDSGDGRKASDFSGLGAQIIASDYANVVIDSMKIDTKGFVRAAFISDSHARLLVKNSEITVLGANPLTQAYQGYKNSADMPKMISPPWVLGIQGGARASNMLGDGATTTMLNSKISSGGWALLSTDGGNSFMMNVVDSTATMLPASQGGMSAGKFPYADKYGSGYGSYMIAKAKENFYGVTMNGTTYATIVTGGDVTYRSSNGAIKLLDGDGKDLMTVNGAGKPSVINSVFGFMSHDDGSVSVLDGTVVNAEDAIFLHKNGTVSFTADNAKLNSKSGVLLQMIDNDDTTVGGSMQGFNTEFNEAAGWPSETDNVTTAAKLKAAAKKAATRVGAPGGPAAAGGPAGPAAGSGGAPAGAPGGPGGPGGGAQKKSGPVVVKLALTNGTYNGNVYNGSGYYNQAAKPLEVTIGKGATLNGAISLTETRHIDETGKQNTHFTINEYYYLGHVTNRNFRNGMSSLSVSLADGGVWKVTGDSWLSKLEMKGGTIEGPNGATAVMKIDGKETPIRPGATYVGKIVIAPADMK
jgi:hypothetical protein